MTALRVHRRHQRQPASQFGLARVAPPGAGGMADGWRDTRVRIEGPAAAQFVDLFMDTWQRQHCPGQRSASPAAGNTYGAISTEPAWRTPGERDRQASRGEQRCACIERCSVRPSAQRIPFTLPWPTVPDPQNPIARCGDADAARRRGGAGAAGYGDSPLALRAGQSHYSRSAGCGAWIFEMHDAFLHAKTVVIDGVWSTVGSANLDWRSFLHKR